MATISIRNLQKAYGTLDVLKGISLDIEEGEFVTLIGPSGCGKSTLLKIIAGLEDASSGEIVIGGVDMTGIPPQERNLAMVFQNYALYPQMTVRKNLSFGLKIAGFSKNDIKKRTDDIAATLEISDYLERLPRQLSGGQRQRVAMGRALVRDPKAFLLDEPLSNLDAALRTTMRTEIKELHQRLNGTMVYVTHDQIEAMTMADRIAIMKDGEIIQFGKPDDLYMNPVNTFVANFFGTPKISLWQGSVESVEGERMSVRVADDAILNVPAIADLQGKKVTIGVRPEALKFAATGIPVSVDVVEPTGSQTQVTIGFAGGIKGSVLVQGRYPHAAGSTVYIDTNIDEVHLFDLNTSNRIN